MRRFGLKNETAGRENETERRGMETSYWKDGVIHPTIGRETAKKQLVSGKDAKNRKGGKNEWGNAAINLQV